MSDPWTTPGPEDPTPLRPPAPGPPGPPVPGLPEGVAYDPNLSYVVYQAGPGGAYAVPVPAFDPLVGADYGGWWRRSADIIKRGWRPIVLIQFVGLVLGLAVAVPDAILSLGALNDFFNQLNANQAEGTADLSGIWRTLGLGLLFSVAGIVVQSVIAVAVNYVVVSVAAGVPVRLGGAFGLAGRRLLPLIGWQLLAGMIVLAGICACVLPALYLYAVLLILPAVVTFERGGSAIARCFQLFHRNFGSSLARIATIIGLILAVAVVGYVVGTVIELASGANGQPTAVTAGGKTTLATVSVSVAIARQAVSTLLRSALGVLTSVLTVTAYADMRGRFEPVNTEVLAREAGVR